jgi:S-adenosylmethionine synthetase
LSIWWNRSPESTTDRGLTPPTCPFGIAHACPHLDLARHGCKNQPPLDWRNAPQEGCSVSHKNFLFTSESVSEGHPDKVCDQISDAILDAFLENDQKLGISDDSAVNTRLGCETLATTNKIVIAGEGRGQAPLFRKHGAKAVVDREAITEIARGVVKDIGYDQDGFSYYGADVEVLLHGQSPDIAMGVDAKKKRGEEQEGAGDQGMMFGFACTESEVYEKNSFMPAPIYFAHKILKVLADKRHSGQLADLQPDSKSQVTVQYVDGKPIGCTKVVVSTQHNAESRNKKKYTPGMVRDLIGDTVASALPKGWMPKKESDFLVNPTGNFVVGGPDGDCGLTGRKIIVDTYGGYAPHGGGAFSGKDPTKVDRSAAYAARYLAKNIVAAGVAERCTIQVAYAIGVADPMSLLVDTHGTGKVEERKLEKILPELFRLTPTNIRRTLKLSRPIYRRTAAYGHFGRAPEKDGGFSWERTDLADAIRRAVK